MTYRFGKLHRLVFLCLSYWCSHGQWIYLHCANCESWLHDWMWRHALIHGHLIFVFRHFRQKYPLPLKPRSHNSFHDIKANFMIRDCRSWPCWLQELRVLRREDQDRQGWIPCWHMGGYCYLSGLVLAPLVSSALLRHMVVLILSMASMSEQMISSTDLL